jgi:hypothetical protein
MNISNHDKHLDQPDGDNEPSRPSRRAMIRLAAGAAIVGAAGIAGSVAGGAPAFASTCTNACSNFLTTCVTYCRDHGLGNSCVYGCNRLYGECKTCCQNGGTPEECVQNGPNSYRVAQHIDTLFLTAGGVVVSDTLKAKLIFQADGNLVVYDENDRARWASHTVNRGSYTLFQPDGNFVVYAVDHTTQSAVWASNTCCRIGAYLSVQDDGNVVIYNSANFALWATHTNH